MAKLISILFSILILFQSFNLQLEDYSKISALFEHAQFHDDNYGDSIIDFVVQHYNTSYFDSDKQHKEHKNLPFKNERSSKNQVTSFTLNLDSYTFNNITFSYDDTTEVLRNISFEAPQGSVTALVGSSGSGKSTIASLVTAFLNPNSGQVLIDEIDLSKVDLKSFRSQLGVVLQDDFLYE